MADDVKKEKKPTEQQSHDFNRFIKTVPGSSDTVTMVLKSHLLAEFYLDSIIAAELDRGDIIVDSRLTFYDKLIIIQAFDKMHDSLLASLKKLNEVRNSSSHELDFKVSEADIDKIGRPLGSSYIKARKKNLGKPKDLLYHTLVILMARTCGCMNTAMEARVARDKEESVSGQ